MPGVRLTLWLAALIIMAAGVLALMSLRAGARQPSDRERLQELVSGVTRPYSDVRSSHTPSDPTT